MKVMTITGIRPDFIRMSALFKKIDEKFEHILVHTGQHYDRMLSDVFFEELEIRKPDYNLSIGAHGNKHYHQLADLSVKVIDLIKENDLKPDWILFLGDSNSVLASVPLRKEGFKIGHIEAGMRSFDKRMFEETNRIVCDHCSDHLFVYHNDYACNCFKEGIDSKAVSVVGNTIVEVCKPFVKGLKALPKKKDCILMDIHRPENFNHKDRMGNILSQAKDYGVVYDLPVKMLNFGGTIRKIEEYNLSMYGIEVIDLMSYKNYLRAQYDCLFMISDSGTAQEEPALLDTPVLVPRDFTERPQSVSGNCSYKIDANHDITSIFSVSWLNDILEGKIQMSTEWLGDGKTADRIVDILGEI